MAYKIKSAKVPMYVIKARNYEAGLHWFSPSTMKFFNSKVPKDAYVKGDKAYFISSETNPEGEVAYTIREANLKTGDVDTIGEFHSYKTKDEANLKLKEILK